MKNLIFVILALLVIASPAWAVRNGEIKIVVDANETALGAVNDSLDLLICSNINEATQRDTVLTLANTTILNTLNSVKTFLVQTTTSSWAASLGPVTGGAHSEFSGSGIWRIDALGAVAVAGNDATGTNLIFAIAQLGGTGVAMSLVDAIANDAIGTRYDCAMDTVIATVETAPFVPLYAPMDNRNGGFWSIVQANGVGHGYSFFTPPGNWIISDSTDATNAGTRYLWMRATPYSADATLTAN